MENKDYFYMLIIVLLCGVLAVSYYSKDTPYPTENKDSQYTISNRYSRCFERLGGSTDLEYENMKEICSEYLK